MARYTPDGNRIKKAQKDYQCAKCGCDINRESDYVFIEGVMTRLCMKCGEAGADENAKPRPTRTPRDHNPSMEMQADIWRGR